MNKECLIVIIVCFVFGLSIKSQGADSNDIYSDLVRFFAQNQNKEIVTATITDDQIKQADPNRLINSINTQLKTEDTLIRSLSISLLCKVAKLHPTEEIKRKVVNNLVDGLVSNSEIDRGLHWKYGESLLDFTKDSFSENIKDILIRNLDGNDPSKELICVCGVAQIEKTLPRLEELLFNNEAYVKWYYRKGWVARLARARMGVQEDIIKCVSLIEEEIDTNGRWQLLDSLGYLRQPESIESLKKYALSDKRLPSVRSKDEGELYASYIIDILIDSLEDFPVEKKLGRGYRNEAIETARKWMSEQTEWKIIR